MSLPQIGYPQLGACQEPDEPDGKPLHHAQVFQYSRGNDPRDRGPECQSRYQIPDQPRQAKVMSDGTERVGGQEQNSEQEK
jgi:hypothetical protein